MPWGVRLVCFWVPGLLLLADVAREWFDAFMDARQVRRVVALSHPLSLLAFQCLVVVSM